MRSSRESMALVTAIGLALVAGPPPASAQGRWTITPAFTLAEQYDDNIFGTASNRTSDFITRLTPAFSLSYETPQLTLLASYAITGEVYAENSDLNNFGDNQSALLTLGYRVDPRLTLRASGFFARTNDPVTFLTTPTTVPVGVTVVPTTDLGRQLTNQYTASASAEYQFDPRWSGTVGYLFSAVRPETGADSDANTGSVGIGYQLTPQDKLTLTTTGGVFQGTTTDPTVSAVLGWSRQWTPDFTTALGAGPRWTDGTWGVAALASLTYAVTRELSASLGYSLGTGLSVGTVGAQNVSALTAGITYQPLRELKITAYGAWARTSPIGGGSGETTDAFGAGVAASYQLTEWLAAILSYDFADSSEGAGGSVRDNRVQLGLTASYPLRY